jgi:prepilin-type N-terminal cleavage/methylation domain-containing protein
MSPVTHRIPPRASGFTLLELLVVIAIIGILGALLLTVLGPAKCAATNGAVRATITQLGVALAAYETDFGLYPSAGSPLRGDSTVFVKCLRARGPRGTSYFAPREGELNASGELLSAHLEPFYYTYPGRTALGPDGFFHPDFEYYLWTAGCQQPEPDRRCELNNWSK